MRHSSREPSINQAIVLSRDAFMRTKYFQNLDGLRAISVLLVLSFHVGGSAWPLVHGYLGVTVFFVISGFLITTLLLREEKNGRVSIPRFYVRRIFRIFPLYYIALGVYCVLVIGLGLGNDPGRFRENLLLYATYNGEFAGSGSFSHSGSLGIEEKFYLFWPVIGFALLPLLKRRVSVVTGLLLLSIIAAAFQGLDYFAIYAPILTGVLVALLLNDPRAFEMIRRLAGSSVGALCVAALIVAIGLNHEGTYVHVGIGLLVGLCMPWMALSNSAVTVVLAKGPLRYIGTRSYAIYLFHPLVLRGVDAAIPESSHLLAQLARLLLLVFGSLIVAEILHRTVERPLIAIGHRIASLKLTAPLVESS